MSCLLVPVDFLSDEQVARYRRFRDEGSVAELEQFLHLDAKALDVPAGKRRPATMLGWAMRRGTVRMLGTFLVDAPLELPAEVMEFVAGQLDIDPACAPECLTRPKTAYEHFGRPTPASLVPRPTSRSSRPPGLVGGVQFSRTRAPMEPAEVC
jgi:hypothetical protein